MSDTDGEFHRRIFETARIGIFETRADGRLLRVNAHLARLFGFASPDDMIRLGGDVGDGYFARRTDRERYAAAMRADGAVVDFVAEARRHDGGRFWFCLSATRLRAEEGSGNVVGTLFDVTALVEAQDRAFEAENAHRSIFENAAIGMYRSTPDGRQLRANPALVRFNGYETETELLAAVKDIAAEWYVEPGRRAEFARRLESEGRITGFVSEVFRHKTRERVWISESAWIVRRPDGGVLCYEGTVEDITERHQAQERLARALAAAEESEADYRSIFDNADFGIYRTRPDGIQIRANPALARINGFASEAEQLEAVARAHGSGNGWYVDPERRAVFREILFREGTVKNFESEVIRRATGERAWISENCWLIRDKAGNVVCYEGTITDITERKRADVELHEAKTAAEAASAAKSAFLAVMSHELRTPLNAIIGFAEIIEGRMFGDTDRRYFEYAADIRSSGSHLLRLINDILDLSKIGAGRLDLTDTPIVLDDLVAGTIKLFAANATKAELQIVADVADPALAVWADSLRLQQVLMNLVSNAIKFTPPGGQVRVFARAGDDAVRIGVADSGVGMTPEEAKAAMEPFVQIDARLARRHEGTGLGLSISRELVALHGGRLVIDSAKGTGTTVTIELPTNRLMKAR